MKKGLFLILLFVIGCGQIFAQTPTTLWSNNANTQWYNAQNTIFTLTTPNELAGLAELVANGNDFAGNIIIVGNDLDLGAHLWRPIGVDNSAPFSGNFDAGKHTISNIFIATPTIDNVGLFGWCVGANISNVNIQTTDIKGKDNVGALVGNLFNSGQISNCHATGVKIVSTGDNIGGLVGGLVKNSEIRLSSASGNVRGGTQVGGLLGSPYNGGLISECFSAGKVSAVHAAGGFTGASVVGFPGTTNSIIKDCYSRADAKSDSGYVGGFCGNFNSLLEIDNCYSTGAVSTSPNTYYDGGFIGAGGTVIANNCYWDSTSSQYNVGVGGWLGAPGNPSIHPKPTTTMKTMAMVDSLNQGNGPWTIDPNVNDGYPSFISNTSAVATESMNNSLKVFPSPFHQTIHITSNKVLKQYTIFSIKGAIVQSGKLHKNKAVIRIKNVENGIYFIHVITNQGLITKKLIKQ